MTLDYVEYICDGLCESPHDFPARWACMIYGYFDESENADTGYMVVAGFVATKKCWEEYVRQWAEVTQRRPLHIKNMRLGGKHGERQREKLERLGAIPKRVGLKPFVGSVRTGEYRHLTTGTTADLVLNGYTVALLAMVDAILESDLPKKERIEFIFEQQKIYAVARERVFESFRQMPKYKAHHGLSRIAKSSSMEKSIILEASDYLAYATLYELLEPTSQQARLTAPILREYGGRVNHKRVDKSQIMELLRIHAEESGHIELPQIDRNRKAYIKEMLKKDLEGGMKWTNAILSKKQ